MEIMNVIAWVGGVLSVLTFLHFVSDWIFQSHDEAMRKSTDSLVRARHCLVYTGLISAVFIFGFHLPLLDIGVYATILFTSHFIEDSYLPVYLWAKYIRKAPEFNVPPAPGTTTTDLERFKLFASTVLGKILLIAIDQIIHILYLGFIAAMMRVSGTPDFWKLYGITLFSIVVLAGFSWSAKIELLKPEKSPDVATPRRA
jgi:hypothetical protein